MYEILSLSFIYNLMKTLEQPDTVLVSNDKNLDLLSCNVRTLSHSLQFSPDNIRVDGG